MKIDVSKANLQEKDIEDWLYENPDKLTDDDDYLDWATENPMARWIGRQYQLPSGIADLIGVREDGLLVVVEIKNVAINKAAVLQVCRYANDLQNIVNYRMNYPFVLPDGKPQIEMILVGPSIDGQTFSEARSLGIRVMQFLVELNLNITGLEFNQEHEREVEDQRKSISDRPEWDIYGLTIDDDIEQRMGRREVELITDSSADEKCADIVLSDDMEE